MADFYQQINKNTWFSYALMAIMASVAFLAIFFFAYVFDLGDGGLMLAIVIAIGYLLVSYYYSDSIVLSMSNAKEVEKKEYPYLFNTVEGLSLAAGIPMPKLYVIPDDAPNAFATGRDPQHSSIAVTSGLLKIMNRQELEGVLAHEMSHIKNFDIRFATLAVVMVGMVAIIGEIAIRMLWFGGGHGNDRKGEGAGILMIIGLVFVILAPIFAQLVRLAISRKREYLADASGALLTRYPPGLASALEKIGKYGKPVKSATDSTAPLYFANPLASKNFLNFLSTHPPIEDRIKALREM